MIKTRVVVVSLLAAATLTACKSGDKLSQISVPKKSTTTTSTTLKNFGTAPDGSPIVGPSGATTTPEPALAAPNLVKNTGTTSVSTKPNTDHLALPKAGDYTFRDTRTEPDDAFDAHYRLTLAGKTVRTQQTEVAAAPGQESYYEESHRSDGLFLVNSVIAGGSCTWSPAAASLPQSVIDGGSASTKSTCSTKTNGLDLSFELSVDLAFKRLRTVTIGGKEYRCIDVTRHRVLTSGSSVETVDSTDTYAFDLGIRIAVDEVIKRQDGSETKTHRHKTVLTALPS